MTPRRIFLSYRRDDTGADAGRIFDRLEAHFGPGNVFKDVDSIPPGADFRRHVISYIGSCDAVLVLIGSNWTLVRDGSNKARLLQSDDLVRIEIETALNIDGIRVIPVLVGGAALPQSNDLPVTLQPLLLKHAATVRRDPDFSRDVQRLIESLDPMGVNIAQLSNSQWKISYSLKESNGWRSAINARCVRLHGDGRVGSGDGDDTSLGWGIASTSRWSAEEGHIVIDLLFKNGAKSLHRGSLDHGEIAGDCKHFNRGLLGGGFDYEYRFRASRW